MVSMYTQFKKILERYDLLKNDKKVIIAVSGGVDSMVLLHLMQSISEDRRPEIIVAHINHKLRPESIQEEVLVRELAKRYGLECHSHIWLESEHPSSGIEEAARNVRYTFLKEVMAKTAAHIVMTAHHQDDQVETILMKLVRGSSLQQMTGIEEAQSFGQGQLMRPLLSFMKEELYAYAETNSLAYIEDQSNQTLDYTRNRFRNAIIPLLKEENQQFNTHINQFKMDLEDLLTIASAPIDKSFIELVTIEHGQIAFHQEDLEAFDEPMQRALLRKVLDTIYKDKEEPYKANYVFLIQNWLREAQGHSHLQLTGGVTIEKSYQDITLYQSTDTTDDPNDLSLTISLDDTRQKRSLSATESIELNTISREELADLVADDPSYLVFQADAVRFPLTIRHRLPGDRMQYQGLGGTKKIKDIFIDEKTPLKDRDKAWIVEDATGQILWLISYRKMYLLSQLETDKLTYILKYNH